MSILSTSHDAWISSCLVFCSLLPRRTIPAAGSSIRLDPISTQHLHPLQGAMASPSSIYHLWKALDINLSIGRACGEFVALRQIRAEAFECPVENVNITLCVVVLDNAVTAQNFEYKMSNSPENPLYVASDFLPTSLTSSYSESVFGYITVLPRPGAFSAYQYVEPQKSPTLMTSVRYRSTSSVNQCAWIPSFRGPSLLAVERCRCEHLNGKHLPG